MKKSFNTTVSVKDGTSRSVLKGIVQHDTLNEVNIRLTDGSRPFDYTGYTSIIFKALKADGTSYVDSEGNSVIAANPSGGLITVILKGQATAAVGLCQCVIEIYAGGEKMTSARLNYEVSASLGTDEGAASESQYPAFQKLLSDLSNIEADATAAGGYATRAEKAANTAEMWAKGSQNIAEGDFATRAELEAVKAGAAPAGYGYGGVPMVLQCATEDALNAALTTLVNTMRDGEARQIRIHNYPALYSSQTFVGTLYRYIGQNDNLYAALSCFSPIGLTGGISYLSKACVNSVWTPWEHSNPPMSSGIEYRTIERYNGYSVYKKLVSFGALPNSTSKTVDAEFGSGYIIGIESVFSTNQGKCLIKHKDISDIVCSGANITISTTSDMSGHNVMVLVKYYKTTV